MNTNHWEWKPIGDLFEIGAGKTMSPKARMGSSMTPFLRTSNIFWDEIDLSTVDKMSIPEHELSEKSLRVGDLLVCEGGEIGRSAIWDGELPLASFQNHLHRLRPKKYKVDPKFYVYFLQSAFTQLGIFEGAGNKTTIPNLSRNRLAALDVPYPPIGEQNAIAKTLGYIRKAVKANDDSVRISEQLKRSTMQSLFTRGLRQEAQKETEFGTTPANWQVLPIRDFIKQAQYGLNVRGETKGKYPNLRMNCQEDGKVILRNLQYVDIDDSTFQAYRLHKNDILFNRTNSYELVGRTAIFEQDADVVFASYLVRVEVDKNRMNPHFLNYFLNWEVTQSELKKLASRGVSQANISAGKLRDFAIPVPPTLKEQNEVVEIFSAIDQKIDLHKRKRIILDALFKSMLHKLMTGEIRVSDLDLSAIEKEVTK